MSAEYIKRGGLLAKNDQQESKGLKCSGDIGELTFGGGGFQGTRAAGWGSERSQGYQECQPSGPSCLPWTLRTPPGGHAAGVWVKQAGRRKACLSLSCERQRTGGWPAHSVQLGLAL